MLRVEFHCHTVCSADSLVSPRSLVEACKRKNIDRVIVTDHNQIQGALEARELDPQRVIVGEEIRTTQGELLAAYVKERIPRGLHPAVAIRQLREQGALISVSHPFDPRRGWKLEDLLEIFPLVDAIEIYNSRCSSEQPNQEAEAFARQHHLLGTAGSDAHSILELGRSTLRLPEFSNAAELKTALRAAVPETKLSGQWVHFLSSYARLKKAMVPRRQAAPGEDC